MSLEILPSGEFEIVKIDKVYIYVKLGKDNILRLPVADLPGVMQDIKSQNACKVEQSRVIIDS